MKAQNEIKQIKEEITNQQKKFDNYKRQFKLTNNTAKDLEYDPIYFKNEIEKLRIKVIKYEEVIRINNLKNKNITSSFLPGHV